MSKLLILVGAPGSGKSTFARYFLRTEDNWIRVNRDDFRLMQFGDSLMISVLKLCISQYRKYIL